MCKYSIGLDFGTNSCRALIVSLSKGNELASHVCFYNSGKEGVIIDPADPNLARQNPIDYLTGIENTITEALRKAEKSDPSFNPADVIGIGVDTTGSSPMPIDEEGNPLSFQKKFKDNPDAMVWLWKDHTSFEEAELITQTAQKIRPQYLSKIGGVYSSEWFWSKILRCKNTNEEVFNSAYSFIEICDWIPAALSGNLKPEKIKRSVCAAGHKAMFDETWGGLPDEEFLNTLSPGLGKLRSRLFSTVYTSEKKVGNLSKEWAAKLGLPEKTVVAVGAFDAHMGAVGAGIKEGTLVKIIGTSTCDIMIAPNKKTLSDIPGVCGIVNGSVMDNYFGIEAGQSAVGDIFLWFVNNLVPEKYGSTADEKFKNLETEASKLSPGESGLLALDWNNGNRTILVDVRLSGLLLGQTLHTQPHEIYRALIEATAFGALEIINRIGDFGVEIKEVINCGGLAVKNTLMMQIYADIIGRPMKISASEQTPALGAAIFASVASGTDNGGYKSVIDAQREMTGISKVYNPVGENHLVYKKIFRLYNQLHNSFGLTDNNYSMFNVMKDLLEIRDEVRRTK